MSPTAFSCISGRSSIKNREKKKTWPFVAFGEYKVEKSQGGVAEYANRAALTKSEREKEKNMSKQI